MKDQGINKYSSLQVAIFQELRLGKYAPLDEEAEQAACIFWHGNRGA